MIPKRMLDSLGGPDLMCKLNRSERMMAHQFTAAVQAAVVTTINTLGTTLLGPKFTPITASPIPDDEVARIAGVDFTVHRDPPFYDTATCPRCSHDSHMDDCPCGCERP